ncbi:regulatory protein RecX [uncultured Faecalibaculum sp.]|uniref:regulatory protein RecX n=1 Tax=uncultured Faecalibaculum sp. TaxID=1729681 RepID=UPI0025D31AA0|nr:RecX family transcriptional regulator [uncultured Faecalibaculum sp.]
MKITGLRKNRTNDRISVDIDGSFAASVSLETLMTLGIRTDSELTEHQYRQLKQHSDTEAAAACAAAILKYGPRTEKEMYRKLTDKGFSREITAHVIETLKKLQLVDDAEYCRSFVRIHRDLNGWGPDKIHHALLEKGLVPELIQQAQDELYDRETARQRALEAGSRKLKQMKRKTGSGGEIRQKLYRFLYSRGFDSEVCQSAANELLRNAED